MKTYDDSRAKTIARLFLCREGLKKLQKYVILYKKEYAYCFKGTRNT